MTEPFTSFAQSYRVVFTSILALGSSGMISSGVIFGGLSSPSKMIGILYLFDVILFSGAILTTIISGFVGLKEELRDGYGGKEQRQINFIKFKIISIAVLLLFLGIVFNVAFLLALIIS